MQKIALVTGGSRGIGKAITLQLQREKIHVLAPTRQELDLEYPDSIDSYFTKLNAANQKIQILVNNAGYNPVVPWQNLSLSEWNKVMMINLSAPFLLAQKVAPSMLENQWGRIVNISSLYGIVSRIGRTAYTASKTGLLGLTRNLALEFAGHGVLVNAICPGIVDTEMTKNNNTPAILEQLAKRIPLGRIASPDEISELVSFLVSEKNNYITGQVINIDGGMLVG